MCIARSYIDRELLLEVDEGDARFCSDVASLNVDLGTCESESEKKKSRSAALITHDTDLVHPVGTKDKVGRTPNVVGTYSAPIMRPVRCSRRKRGGILQYSKAQM